MWTYPVNSPRMLPQSLNARTFPRSAVSRLRGRNLAKNPPQTRGERRVNLILLECFSETELSKYRFPETAVAAGGLPMQAHTGIQNATINANAAIFAGQGVDAANAHRTYLRKPSACEAGPVSKRPHLGVVSSTCSSCGTDDPHRGRMSSDAMQEQTGTSPETLKLHGRSWRLDSRHLPETAWAMLILNRAMCG